ncbi:MAG: SGNH/GDSL hydrolase family protein [Candidatus Sumerlaeota bacterium]|nr:SGNH/GDSL hydrolase family protein [Candidatus Sumerlaeota bacterium]
MMLEVKRMRNLGLAAAMAALCAIFSAGAFAQDAPAKKEKAPTAKAAADAKDAKSKDGVAKDAKSQDAAAKTAKKPDPAMAPITDDPNLPRVLLIGDSISIGYTLPTRDLLKGKANVHRILENGASTREGLAKLDKWLGEKKWDVIHFNWGLHDLKHIVGAKLDLKGEQNISLADYEKNLRELVKRLKATGAQLIWTSTTPVPAGADGRMTGDVPLYNAVALKIMQENNVPVDDLYAVVQAKCEPLRTSANNVHFKPEGYKILAESAAASIEAALKKK